MIKNIAERAEQQRKSPFKDTEEAADYFDCSPRLLEALRAKGEGPDYFRLGRNVRYRVDDLDEWARSEAKKRA